MYFWNFLPCVYCVYPWVCFYTSIKRNKKLKRMTPNCSYRLSCGIMNDFHFFKSILSECFIVCNILHIILVSEGSYFGKKTSWVFFFVVRKISCHVLVYERIIFFTCFLSICETNSLSNSFICTAWIHLSSPGHWVLNFQKWCLKLLLHSYPRSWQGWWNLCSFIKSECHFYL